MLPRFLFCLLPLLRIVIGDQKFLEPPATEEIYIPKVAIIGAGIAGASAAYHLRESYAYKDIDITINEANDQVGGEIKSASFHDGKYGVQQVELGARSFFADDQCVQSLVDETGLRKRLSTRPSFHGSLGVWNGTDFLIRDDDDLFPKTSIDWARYERRYGCSVQTLRNWVSEELPLYRRSIGRYRHTRQSLGRWRYAERTFADDMRVEGLSIELDSTASTFLSNLTSPDFAKDIVEPITREWSGQNLAEMSSLAVLVALNPIATNSMGNGNNLELVKRLLKLSEVDLRLHSTVTKILKSPVRTYHLISDTGGQYIDNEEADYDAVIIATPLQVANVELDIDSNVASADSYSYLGSEVPRHVTHFTCPDFLSPAYFNVASRSFIPRKIYTTQASNNGYPPVLSIEHAIADLGLDGCMLQGEDMFRVETTSPLTNTSILGLLGTRANLTLEQAGVR